MTGNVSENVKADVKPDGETTKAKTAEENAQADVDSAQKDVDNAQQEVNTAKADLDSLKVMRQVQIPHIQINKPRLMLLKRLKQIRSLL